MVGEPGRSKLDTHLNYSFSLCREGVGYRGHEFCSCLQGVCLRGHVCLVEGFVHSHTKPRPPTWPPSVVKLRCWLSSAYSCPISDCSECRWNGGWAWSPLETPALSVPSPALSGKAASLCCLLAASSDHISSPHPQAILCPHGLRHAPIERPSPKQVTWLPSPALPCFQ